MDRAVKKVQEAAPFLKNLCLILLLCQLIVDILKLNCFRIIIRADPADAILEHSVYRQALLGSPRNIIILSCVFYDLQDLVLIFP